MFLAFASPAAAAVPGVAKFDGADNAWLLLCSALVLMMTIPGLALFYGGMVRRKNVLSTLKRCDRQLRRLAAFDDRLDDPR